MAAATSSATVTGKFVGSTNALFPANMNTSTTKTADNEDGNETNGQSSFGFEDVLSGGDGGIAEDHQNQQQVPIWVGLSCKLVSGISKSTTCHDLIYSIVPSSQDPSKYVIVEKWKKMERVLDPSVKILKVWKAWGDQIGDVSFALRSSPTADGYIDKKASRKVHRKRSSNYHQQKPSCHEDDCDKEGHRDAMEQLIKLVLTQGEAIQAQLKKLRQQEEQIEKYEEKMHKIRSSQLGENYVVETYLKDDVGKPRRVKRREKSPCKRDAHGNHHHHHHAHHYHHHRPKRTNQPQSDVCEDVPEQENVVIALDTSEKPQSGESAVTTVPATVDPETEEASELPAESSDSIKEKTEVMESIFQLNVRLTQEEERLVKLGLKIRKLSDKQRKAEWEELALQDISQELEHLKQVTNEQSQEIETNERNLTALEQFLDDKHDHIAFLTHEIQLVDEQSEILQRKVLEMNAISGRPGSSHHSSHQQHQVYSPESYPTHDQHQEYTTRTTANNNEEEEVDDDDDEANPYLNDENTEVSSSSSCQLKRSENLNNSIRSYSSIQQHAPSPSSVQYQTASQQQESCSSSCSNSSSMCGHLGQKQCSSGDGNNSAGNGVPTNSTTDHQDNDSNSDTGISSLHSSVDESPMYVLDTLV